MSELLKTKRIAYELENLIVSANKFICIFTYSLKIDTIFIDRLKGAGRRGVGITFVFGREPNDMTSLLELQKIENCKIYFKEKLHAKFYYNEDTLIIATMNLSEFSEEKNYELGVLFKKENNHNIFESIKKEAKEIVENAKPWNTGGISSSIAKQKVNQFSAKELSGFCIRCKVKIDYDPSRSLCYHCYDIWSEWEDEGFEENYCHKCGTDREYVSKAKPECFKCYTSY